MGIYSDNVQAICTSQAHRQYSAIGTYRWTIVRKYLKSANLCWRPWIWRVLLQHVAIFFPSLFVQTWTYINLNPLLLYNWYPFEISPWKSADCSEIPSDWKIGLCPHVQGTAPALHSLKVRFILYLKAALPQCLPGSFKMRLWAATGVV